MGKPRPLPKSGPKAGPKESEPKAPVKPAAAKPAIKAKPAEARSASVANGKPKKAGANGELRASVGMAAVQVRPAQPEVVIPETPPPLPSPIASFTF